MAFVFYWKDVLTLEWLIVLLNFSSLSLMCPLAICQDLWNNAFHQGEKDLLNNGKISCFKNINYHHELSLNISFFSFIFKLYKIVLVLPNIKMNPPQVYMCSRSWTLLPPPSPHHPPGSSQCTSPSIQYCASILDWQIFSYMIFYMFQCHSPKSSHPLTLPQSP